jgi:hypothetical protein
MFYSRRQGFFPIGGGFSGGDTKSRAVVGFLPKGRFGAGGVQWCLGRVNSLLGSGQI